MTRDEALGKLSHLYSQADSLFLVNALEALGLLKLDESKSVEDRARDILRSDGYDPNIVSLLDAAGLKIVEK